MADVRCGPHNSRHECTDPAARKVQLAKEKAQAQREADDRALWAVRVLDRWSDKHLTSDAYSTRKRPGERHGCMSRSHAKKYWGDSYDAARIAAAEAMVAQDPTLEEANDEQ